MDPTFLFPGRLYKFVGSGESIVSHYPKTLLYSASNDPFKVDFDNLLKRLKKQVVGN